MHFGCQCGQSTHLSVSTCFLWTKSIVIGIRLNNILYNIMYTSLYRAFSVPTHCIQMVCERIHCGEKEVICHFINLNWITKTLGQCLVYFIVCLTVAC